MFKGEKKEQGQGGINNKDDKERSYDAISKDSEQIVEMIKDDIMAISEDNLKINIPETKVAGGEVAHVAEVEDEVEVKEKRKKCRVQKTKYY